MRPDDIRAAAQMAVIQAGRPDAFPRQKYWKEEINGSNAFFQRTKLVIFHVPHWKTGAQLAEEVARSRR